MKLTIKVAAQIEQLESLVKKLSALLAHCPNIDITVDFTVNNKTNAESPKEAIDIVTHEALKTGFVEKELFFLLRAANSKIADTAYCTKDSEEWVLVTMENGSEYHIDITADSLLAAATDVCRFMMNR